MLEQFAQLDTVVLGLSGDTIDLQQKFTDAEKLTFPLFADTAKAGYKAFGVTGRETFVIDKKGIVRKVYAPVGNAGQHPAEVLQWVKENLK